MDKKNRKFIEEVFFIIDQFRKENLIEYPNEYFSDDDESVDTDRYR